jgi:sigma-B regulation protein RsbU (phosphoserine phosphatase)
LDVAARWEPAAAFGGDCYDALQLSDTRLAVSIADVCGKGLPAALLMSNLLASLRAFASSERSPREVVSSTNRALCRQTDLRRFVTLFHSVYDSSTRLLTYTNAGHNPPVVARRDGTVERLVTGGTVTGIFEEASYAEGLVGLEPGDRLVLFTDVITEARSAAGEEFEEKGLLRAIERHRGADATSLVGAIFEQVAAFTGGALQDDATVVVASLT